MSKIVRPHVLVILMTITSGCADAISFLALGQVLTAAMTGNTVFLGLALAHAGGLIPLGYVFALLGFMCGAAAGSFLLRKHRDIKGVTGAVIATLTLEACGMLAFGIVSIFAATSSGFLLRSILIILLAFSMGCQGAAARRVAVNGVPTTVITSTTTGLVESLVWNAYGKLARDKSQIAVGAPPAAVPSTSIVLWIVDIISYGSGAALCGIAELHWHLHAIWVPFAMVSVIIISSVISRSTLREHHENQVSA